MLSEDTFLKCLAFIKEKNKLQDEFSEMLERMAPGFRCDALVYCDYCDMLLKALGEALGDETDLIGYKLYEFDSLDANSQAEALEVMPYLSSWSAVYNHLVACLGDGGK